MFNLLNLFKKSNQFDEVDMSYFDCEDSVEAALNYLDNHPYCTIEEYEEWLSHREEAVKEMGENYN